MIQPNFDTTSSPIADMIGKSFSFENVDISNDSSAGEEGKDDDNNLCSDDNNKNAQNEAGNKQSDDVDGGKDEAEEELGRTAEGDKKVISVLAEEGGKDEGAKNAEHDESEDHGEVAGKDDGDGGKESGDGADQAEKEMGRTAEGDKKVISVLAVEGGKDDGAKNAEHDEGEDQGEVAGKDDGDEGKESGDGADQLNVNEEGSHTSQGGKKLADERNINDSNPEKSRNDVATVSTGGTKRNKNVQSGDDDQSDNDQKKVNKKAKKSVSNREDEDKRLIDFEASVQQRLRVLNKDRKQKKEFEYNDALKDTVKHAGNGKAGLVKWWDDIKIIFNSDMKPKGRNVNQVADEITKEISTKKEETKGAK